MKNQEFHILLEKFKARQLDDASIARFMQLVASGRYDEFLKDDIVQLLDEYKTRQQSGWTEKDQQMVLLQLLKKVREDPRPIVVQMRPRRRFGNIAAIALITAGIGAGAWLIKMEKRQQQAPQLAAKQIAPGGNKAVLMLGNGTIVELDSSSMASKQLGQLGAANIQVGNGKLSYQQTASATPGDTAINVLRVPKGGQYHLALSDGTQVWLNSGSSLEFPAVFSGNERIVRLKGEAYFEVAANAAKPFSVKVNNMNVEVLGTHFNVMAYDDEETINTTLIEGAVRVKHGNNSELLKPGQQAQLHQNGSITVEAVDVDEEIAWKNGLFLFKDADITTVMRQLSRWYNVEIVYEGNVKTKKFTGEVYRNYNLNQILAVFQATGLHFRTEGNKLIVTP
ncbi:MAG TPA: FecR domain-containing protein [Chitinophaga sp.]|uniref:FecR family protein n=1 Tax=Chitinophaga sp. TaxID=1869181 RepID=UPI002C016C14|nr:FecR domain-containing protein [Chitinophaga sp.]HVI46342.1 FecR domain-containing protein [Chitinophaga sp.]